MDAKSKILEFAERRSFFRASEAERCLKVSRVYLKRLIEEGKIVKTARGLYSLPQKNPGEMHDWIEAAAKAPNAVFCLLSALKFHGLTTQNPFELWIAIRQNRRPPKIENIPIRVFRFSEKVFQAGIEKHEIGGLEIKVYSAAKTIADCFRYQREVGFDVALEALRDAWAKRKATMDELYHFAELRNVKNKMLPYLKTLG